MSCWILGPPNKSLMWLKKTISIIENESVRSNYSNCASLSSQRTIQPKSVFSPVLPLSAGRSLFFASSFRKTTMWCHSNWSLNYMSKVRERGGLIHHGGEARQFELAAVSFGALKTREACLKLRCKAGLAAKLSMTPRSVTQVYAKPRVFFFFLNFTADKQTKLSTSLVPF